MVSLAIGCDGAPVALPELRMLWETGKPSLINPTDVAIHPERDRALVADPGIPGIVALDIETGKVLSVQRVRTTGDAWLAPEHIAFSARTNLGAVFDAVAQTVDIVDGDLGSVSRVVLSRVMLGVKDMMPLDGSTVIVAGGSASDSIPPLGIWRFTSTDTTVAELPSLGDSVAFSPALLARQVVAGGQLAKAARGLIVATAVQGDIWLLEDSDARRVAKGIRESFDLDSVVPGSSGAGARRIWWSFPSVVEVLPLKGGAFLVMYSAPDDELVRVYRLTSDGQPSLVYEWRDRVRAATAVCVDVYLVILERDRGSRTVALVRIPGVDAGDGGGRPSEVR